MFVTKLIKHIVPTKLLALYIVSFLCALGVRAAEPPRFVSGLVLDSATLRPVPLANIAVANSRRRATADTTGHFRLDLRKSDRRLRFTAEGFRPVNVDLLPGSTTSMRVLMPAADYVLEEVVVRPKKQKYSKKNNPAVDLMQRIRQNADKSDPLARDSFYTYDKYEKIILALNDMKAEPGRNWFDRKFNFIYQYLDTNDISGSRILPVSVKEKVARMLNSRHPDRHKEVVTGIRRRGIEKNMESDNVQAFVEDVFREIDIYSNDITLLQNRFVSPLSRIGADFYKYFITDTVPIAGRPHIELTFIPRTPQTFGFNGRLYTPVTDTTGFVSKVVMTAPRQLNLNYLKSLYVVQDFTADSLGRRHKVNDDMTVEFQLLPGTQGLYGRRQTHLSGFTAEADTTYARYYSAEGDSFVLADAERLDDSWWAPRAAATSGIDGSRMAEFASRLRRQPIYTWAVRIVKLLSSGYIKTGSPSKFDIGPLNTFLSYNNAEGLRLRAGGMTTAHLNPHIFFRGYAAYGFHDHKPKYEADLEYSFTPKKYHSREFPVNGLALIHRYDIFAVGQNYSFTNADNIFLSLKRKPENLVTYRRLTSLSYKMERRSGFSFEVGLKMQRHEATRWLPFENGYGNLFSHYNTAAFTAMLRYAPGEKFVQLISTRKPVNLDAPVVMLTHEYGPRRLLGADFTMNKTEISVMHRFWLSAFGYIDVIGKAGKIWSRVQYPELLWPNANLSYTIQPESYPLLNPLEFANDSYASWEATYWANGALLNRIPGVSRLKLREVISFRGLIGTLSSKNNPERCNTLYRFPYDAHVGRMHGKPYMEASVGLDNIFTFLRVDYVWRLTYRHTPDTDIRGVRISLHFSF